MSECGHMGGPLVSVQGNTAVHCEAQSVIVASYSSMKRANIDDLEATDHPVPQLNQGVDPEPSRRSKRAKADSPSTAQEAVKSCSVNEKVGRDEGMDGVQDAGSNTTISSHGVNRQGPCGVRVSIHGQWRGANMVIGWK